MCDRPCAESTGMRSQTLSSCFTHGRDCQSWWACSGYSNSSTFTLILGSSSNVSIASAKVVRPQRLLARLHRQTYTPKRAPWLNCEWSGRGRTTLRLSISAALALVLSAPQQSPAEAAHPLANMQQRPGVAAPACAQHLALQAPAGRARLCLISRAPRSPWRC